MALKPESPDVIEPYLHLNAAVGYAYMPPVFHAPLQVPNVMPFVLDRTMKGDAGRAFAGDGAYQYLGNYTTIWIPFTERWRATDVPLDKFGRAVMVVASKPSDGYPSRLQERVAEGIFNLVTGIEPAADAYEVWRQKVASIMHSRRRIADARRRRD